MVFRDHPLMRYCSAPSWPPVWVWMGGLGDKYPKGEIGVFRRLEESYIQPSNKCFLLIDHEESSYMGCLMVNDHAFYTQIVRFLQHCYDRPVAEIGSLDLSYTL
jgi:hypothetical protein